MTVPTPSSATLPADALLPGASAVSPRYTVGTLSYTLRGLVFLFVWLLLGDFCYQMMEAVTPAIIPLTLRDLGASNQIIGLIIITIPGVFDILVCPWVSYASDRHRSPRGRRIPFILKTLPFLVLFMVLLALSPELSAWFHRLLPASWNISLSAVSIALIGFFMVGFSFFNNFVGSVFWYLFNDVVPHAFLGRFLGLFRVVAGLQVMLFSYFIFPYAVVHMRAIYIGTAVLYAVGIGLMCFKVKEGAYPPPPPTSDGGHGFVSLFKTYFKECYAQPYYWNFFLCNACWGVAGTIMVFYVFLQQSVGLDLKHIGQINAAVGLVSLLLTYPAGALGDRFHPLRVLLWVKIINLAFLPIGTIWLLVDFSPGSVFAVALIIAIINLPFGVLAEAMMLPMYMRVLPRVRYGQFCSANALVRSFAVIVGGMLAGAFLDVAKHLCHESDYAYRYIPLWSIAWSGAALFFLWRLYVGWKIRQTLPQPEENPAPVS